MVEIYLKKNAIHTAGTLPIVGQRAPDFTLVDRNLENKTLKDFPADRLLLAIVPSLDTDVCSIMAKRLNEWAKKHSQNPILLVSGDLPFAQKRFCGFENVDNITPLSMMRDKEFGLAYGVLIEDGPLAGILARALLVLGEDSKVLYVELVSEVTQEPNYEKAFEMMEIK